VTTVPTIRSSGNEAAMLGFKLGPTRQIVPAMQGVAAAVMGMKFLVPALERRVEPDDLARVLEHTGTPEHRRAREAFWAWQGDFFGDDVIADQAMLDAAVEQMARHLDELNAAAGWSKLQTQTSLGFLVGSVALSVFGGPMTAVSVAGVGLTLVQYLTERVMQGRVPTRAPEAAVFAVGKTDLPFVGVKP
jgi:hypothetical protein